MMFWGSHMGFGGWGLLLNGLLWIGLIALGIWLLARLFPTAGSGFGGRREGETRAKTFDPPASALEILQRRYARGELTKEEYETMRHDLAS